MPLRIVLVRHGLSSFNLEQRFQGRDDLSSLIEEGARQARATGSALADLPLTAAYSSPLSRARDTMALVLERQPVPLQPHIDDDLLEIDLAPWSGLRRSEIRQNHPEQERIWRQAPETLELRRQDGAPYRPLPELMQQAQRFLDRLLDLHGAALEPSSQATLLVVAHNAILRCLMLAALGLPASGFRRLRLDNASISVLNLERDGHGRCQVQIESLNGTSHLGEPLPPSGPGPRLLLVRHGETDWNREGRFQGQIDIPLNANGQAQAEAARAFLASVPIQRAYTSSMARPRQTAERILLDHPGVPLTSTTGLLEIGHGLWEGRLEREIAETWPELLGDWKREPHTVQMPQGETVQNVWDRSLETWQRIARSLDPTETALVVAHDAVNKTILCALLGLGPEAIWSIKQGNGGVTVVDYPNGAEAMPVVTCMNLTTHLGGVLDRTAAGAL
ncbi:MAG: histidine phosphatase family protein [Synechococcaceae cyanobacterium ELA739]